MFGLKESGLFFLGGEGGVGEEKKKRGRGGRGEEKKRGGGVGGKEEGGRGFCFV